MCGIAGIISADPSRINKTVLQAMAASLAHRGPDGEACWISASGHAGFAHRRLSIIDLSAASAQPMHYASRYTIVYNGEIYNYIELKKDLRQRGYGFSNESDTEVILAMYDLYKEKCLSYLDGMFSFAIWDEQEQMLFCARDRFGEKPFFFFAESNTLYFGSEMKALYAAGIPQNIDHSLLLQFLAHGHTSSDADPSGTFNGKIRRLPAAHCCIFSFRDQHLSVIRYWEIDKNYRSDITEKRAVDRFSELLFQSVKLRLRSDVSVGASLSGGLDSSSIAAVISKSDPGIFKTFTASFPGFEKDESFRARDVAEKCGFENYAVSPSADDLAADLRTLMHHQEEPFTSASVYAQYKVFGLAKENRVTVLLDGQGADETLAGYDKYRRWKLHSLFPERTAAFLQRRETNQLFNNKDINRDYINAWAGKARRYKPVLQSLSDMLYYNTFQSGLEELLRYADRNSMAHGREVRLPFLSHELVSFAFSLPDNLKIRNGWTKWILRTSMDNYLPRHITWQKKKTGFEPPQKRWMEGRAMQEYISDVQAKLVKEGILNASVLGKKRNAHAAYGRNSEVWRYLVAGLFMKGLKIKKGSE
jgi:asparagine synthase (glutamine-hydrolysing)